jgi:hypothetical protein
LSGRDFDASKELPQFRGQYRVSYSDDRGRHSEIVDADAARKQWRFALWGAMSYFTMPNTADGFGYMRWPERNAKNLMPRFVRVQRIIEEEK